jgi:hypothetical protein
MWTREEREGILRKTGADGAQLYIQRAMGVKRPSKEFLEPLMEDQSAYQRARYRMGKAQLKDESGSSWKPNRNRLYQRELSPAPNK